MDYKLYDHGTKDFLGWLRNHGGLLPGDKLRWSGKDWDIMDGPKCTLHSEIPVWQTSLYRRL